MRLNIPYSRRSLSAQGEAEPPVSPAAADLSLMYVSRESYIRQNETVPLRLITGRISMTQIKLCPYRSCAAFSE